MGFSETLFVTSSSDHWYQLTWFQFYLFFCTSDGSSQWWNGKVKGKESEFSKNKNKQTKNNQPEHLDPE